MSVSLHAYGIRPPDEKWKKMKAIWDACTKANVDVPEEVEKFFDYQAPDDLGVVTELDRPSSVCKEYKEEMRDGLEVYLAALDPTVKILRFVVSY